MSVGDWLLFKVPMPHVIRELGTVPRNLSPVKAFGLRGAGVLAPMIRVLCCFAFRYKIVTGGRNCHFLPVFSFYLATHFSKVGWNIPLLGRQAVPSPPTLSVAHKQPPLDEFREPYLDRRPGRAGQPFSFTRGDSP